MVSVLTSVKIDYQLRIFLTKVQIDGFSYNDFIYKSIDNCSEILQKISYSFSSTPYPFTFKFRKETLKKLDDLSIMLHTTRSDIIRRLILAKARKLC